MDDKRENKILKIIISVLIIIIVILLLVFYTNIREKNKTSNQKEYDCTFIRTYKVEYILPSNSEAYLYLTVRAFQDEEVQTIKISKSILPEFEQGKYYEFKFKPIEEIKKDTILDIYQKSKIVSIKKTKKIGLEQTQDKICE